MKLVRPASVKRPGALRVSYAWTRSCSVSGVGLLMRAHWWTLAAVFTAVFSSAVVILFWDGKFKRLPDKGFVGVLINIAVLIVVLLINNSVIAL